MTQRRKSAVVTRAVHLPLPQPPAFFLEWVNGAVLIELSKFGRPYIPPSHTLGLKVHLLPLSPNQHSRRETTNAFKFLFCIKPQKNCSEGFGITWVLP